MNYISYNDFMDYSPIVIRNEIMNIAEDEAKYVLMDGRYIREKNTYENKIIKEKIIKLMNNRQKIFKLIKCTFKNERELKVEDLIKCRMQEKQKYTLYKLQNKSIYIMLKVIDKHNTNLSYSIFSEAMEIIKEWREKEYAENVQYPIVVPIVISIVDEDDQKENIINYDYRFTRYRKNRIDFSYNLFTLKQFMSIIDF